VTVGTGTSAAPSGECCLRTLAAVAVGEPRGGEGGGARVLEAEWLYSGGGCTVVEGQSAVSRAAHAAGGKSCDKCIQGVVGLNVEEPTTARMHAACC
jgi:hypothetical protein